LPEHPRAFAMTDLKFTSPQDSQGEKPSALLIAEMT